MALPALKDLFPEHFFVNPDLTAAPPPQSIVSESAPALASPSSAEVNAGSAGSRIHSHSRSNSNSHSSSYPQVHRQNGRQDHQAQQHVQQNQHTQPHPQQHFHSQSQQNQQQQQQKYPPPAFPLSQVRPRVVAKRRFATPSPPPLPHPSNPLHPPHPAFHPSHESRESQPGPESQDQTHPDSSHSGSISRFRLARPGPKTRWDAKTRSLRTKSQMQLHLEGQDQDQDQSPEDQARALARALNPDADPDTDAAEGRNLEFEHVQVLHDRSTDHIVLLELQTQRAREMEREAERLESRYLPGGTVAGPSAGSGSGGVGSGGHRHGRQGSGGGSGGYAPAQGQARNGNGSRSGYGDERDVTRGFGSNPQHQQHQQHPQQHQQAQAQSQNKSSHKPDTTTNASAASSPLSTLSDSDATDGEGDDGSDDGYYPAHDGDDDEAQKRRHPCPRCGKRFNRPSSLKIHLNTHTGDKPYECPHPGCGRSFNVSSNMRRHYRNHSRRDTPPPLPANAYPVVSREHRTMVNDGYPRVRGGSASLGLGGYGHGPFTGGMPPQYMGYGYYMGMGGMGGMNGMGMGMGMGMNGMNGAMGMNGMNGMPQSPHHMANLGMHPGMHASEMGMHPGMGMYPGMPMHPGMNPNWMMGMGMGPNGMNDPGNMGMNQMSGGGMGMVGGGGGGSIGDSAGGMGSMGGPGAWGPPVSNTRGEKEGEGRNHGLGLGLSNSNSNGAAGYDANSYGGGGASGDARQNGSSIPNGRSGASGHLKTHPADPPTPPYTNEPPSPPPPVLNSDSGWDDAEHPGAGTKRVLVESEEDGGRPTKRVRIEGREGEANASVVGSGSGGGGRPELGDTATFGSVTKTKEGLCQPSPETPSMRNLDGPDTSEEAESDAGVGALHKYRHAESHMRQSSITDASHTSRREQDAYAPPSHMHTHPTSISHPVSATAADANANAVRSDERTHAQYFAGPGHPRSGDEDIANAIYDPSAMQSMQMPFPCYTFPPPMPVANPMAMSGMSPMAAAANGVNGMGMGGMRGMGPMGGMGVSPMQQQPTIPAEPPMAGLGPPPPGEEDPPALVSSLDNGIGRGVKMGLSVCPLPRVGSGAAEAGTSTARQARLEDIDPNLR